MVEIGTRGNVSQIQGKKKVGGQTQRERGWRQERAGKRDRVREKGGGNPISVPIRPNLFWRVTKTARCHYADLQGWREEKHPSLILTE